MNLGAVLIVEYKYPDDWKPDHCQHDDSRLIWAGLYGGLVYCWKYPCEYFDGLWREHDESEYDLALICYKNDGWMQDAMKLV